ncbi:HAD family phosphatase [Maritimibacter sp. UBA3975]|uniref:HAD family hydrolase n=1 Tax=Maritimibacter sp. UBA3975 TaxID=1946833 RepID=UPI000C0A48B3|nr:HAD family phosphatase [Maritimibacter sp. UBA3975]MAM63162.1 haloacid dehalogenase [Maritimibacter sp.]|tara:strand:+ start:39055 stop:39657 length:603 start_codon:yes stop_codon:yes gene_type:complete
MSASIVVFDLGGVLVHWDPVLVWLPDMESEAAVRAFLDRIDFADKNLRADAGERFADLAAEIDDPEDRLRLMGYVSNFARSVPTAIEGTWTLIDRLKARGVTLHAITNWSAETFPTGRATHPRLDTAFGVTVVSGEEKLLKPDARIFDTLCARAGVAAADCLFIDDSARNVEGARAAGMDAVLFTTPEALETDLIERGLL